MDILTRELIKRRAGYCCEYCCLSQRFTGLAHHVEYIVAKQHGGSDDPDNLALACHRCNHHKGPSKLLPYSTPVAQPFPTRSGILH